MRTNIALAVCMLAFIGISCNRNVPVSHSEIPGKEEKTFAKLTIEGMMCERACGSKIAKELQNAPGVLSAEVSFEDGRVDNFASVTWDEKLTNPEEIADVVNAIADGKLYTVKSVEVIHVSKMDSYESSSDKTDDAEKAQLSEQLPLLKVFQFLERLIARPQ